MAATGEPPHVGHVVILSWFGKDDTLRCIRSLRDSASRLRIVVVDNGSFDGVIEAVAAEWPDVHTIQTGENLGFAGGMNQGIEWALTQGASHVTVLNNDTVLDPEAIPRLEAASGESLAVSPEVYFLDQPDRLWFGGGTIDADTRLPHHLHESELARGRVLRPSPILAGCCITASAAVWRGVGLFDERYFLNFEDSEWSVRARSHGFGLSVATDTRILHGVSASFARAPAYIGDYYYARNGLLFNRVVGGGVRSRLRFLRSAVAPGVAGWFREVGFRAGARSLLAIGTATWHYAIGRFGRAPEWIENLSAGARRSG